jgi:hypothetical protein
MAFRSFCALLCLLSLVVELSFDHTNPFVRISPAVTPTLVSTGVINPDACTVDHLCTLTNRSESTQNTAHKAVVSSRGHYSTAAFSFVHFVAEEVHRHFSVEVWHYQYVDRYRLLRPPIFS